MTKFTALQKEKKKKIKARPKKKKTLRAEVFPDPKSDYKLSQV